MPLVSLRRYAKHRGVSLRAVQKAIRSARIATTSDGKIDIDQADADWNRNTAVRRTAPRDLTYSVPVDPPERTRIGRIRDSYLARLAKLEYEERSGQLANRNQIEAAVMMIPTRIAGTLALESDPAAIERILTAELRKALSDDVRAVSGAVFAAGARSEAHSAQTISASLPGAGTVHPAKLPVLQRRQSPR